MTYIQFKQQNTLEERINESSRIIQKYRTRIPIIVEKSKGCSLCDIEKKKYLVPNEMTMSQFIYIIRKKINLKSHETLFVTVNNCLPESNIQLTTIYEKYKDEDGFLYVVYSSENTFG